MNFFQRLKLKWLKAELMDYKRAQKSYQKNIDEDRKRIIKWDWEIVKTLYKINKLDPNFEEPNIG